MKRTKKIILGIFTFLLLVGGVYAVSQTLYTNNKYELPKGGAVAITNKKAKNKNARAILEISTITDGTDKTILSAYKLENGSLILKATKTVGIKTGICVNTKIGTVGKGTWTLKNSALSGKDKYAGWSGIINYISES